MRYRRFNRYNRRFNRRLNRRMRRQLRLFPLFPIFAMFVAVGNVGRYAGRVFFGPFSAVVIGIGIAQLFRLFESDSRNSRDEYDSEDREDGSTDYDFIQRFDDDDAASGYRSSRNTSETYPPSANFCPFCGTKREDGHVYCSECGKKME
ncbi:MAG: zinc ribbon domain-containing protein [Eubacteriaceae bacterium]|nr:zinc ribbon domain-containing protein [Eubacteriaceae bacterium]